jgi:glycosyltransferase involved in cell wall biosynthesis
VRVIAIVAARNEEHFLPSLLRHLFSQGVEVFLIDHGSTDRTRSIAEGYLHQGIVGIETVPFDGPPSPTCPRARYPALPLLEQQLGPEARVVLDDAHRPDELAILDAWNTEFPSWRALPVPPTQKGVAILGRAAPPEAA